MALNSIARSTRPCALSPWAARTRNSRRNPGERLLRPSLCLGGYRCGDASRNQNRASFHSRFQRFWWGGGWICPACNCEIDMKGNTVTPSPEN
jgi:hypothetical protein